jgi:hypothetical protein
MDLNPTDILRLAIDRSSAIMTLWNIFIAVATAVVGVMAKGFAGSRTLKLVLSGAFVIFAASNLWAILRLGELRTALLAMLPADLPNHAAIVASLSPAQAWQYALFHGILDLSVLAIIWLVRWPGAKSGQTAGAR